MINNDCYSFNFVYIAVFMWPSLTTRSMEQSLVARVVRLSRLPLRQRIADLNRAKPRCVRSQPMVVVVVVVVVVTINAKQPLNL